MKNKFRRGFTLVETLVAVVLLSVVGGIIIYNMTNISTNKKDNEYERFVNTVKSAAGIYADLNPDAFNELYNSKSYIYIKSGDLIRSGLLDENLVNPYTDEKIGFDELIKANLDTESGALMFTYPAEVEREEFLVAMSDYIVWGEPYDCMQGAGTYLLSLSEENGDLIDLSDPAMIQKYNFKCSLPSEFADSDRTESDGSVTLKNSTKNAGNYVVTYEWTTESGTKKTANRTLKVMPKVIPSIKTNFPYDINGDNAWYTPTYDVNNNSWNYLTYQAYIEGVDVGTTQYKITKDKCYNHDCEVTGGYTNDFTKVYPVDDGEKNYTVDVIITGRYRKDYNYGATETYTLRQKLVVDTAYVNALDSNWTIDKNVTIKDNINGVKIFSPIGIKSFEYRLSNESLNDSTDVVSSMSFAKASGDTTKNITVRSLPCADYKYNTVYIRAINNEGYVGPWSAPITINLTDEIDLLLTTNKDTCTDSNNCCKASDSTVKAIVPNSACYYTDKDIYVTLGGYKFNVLSVNNDGTFTTAYNDTLSKCVTGTSVVRRNWSVRTCDGVYSGSYNQTITNVNNINQESNKLFESMNNVNLNNYIELSNANNTTAFSRLLNVNEYKLYNKALYANKTLWTSTVENSGTLLSYATSPYPHGNYTTYRNSYFKVFNNGNISTYYSGECGYVKPIVKFKKAYTCQGNGSSSSPYQLSR